MNNNMTFGSEIGQRIQDSTKHLREQRRQDYFTSSLIVKNQYKAMISPSLNKNYRQYKTKLLILMVQIKNSWQIIQPFYTLQLDQQFQQTQIGVKKQAIQKQQYSQQFVKRTGMLNNLKQKIQTSYQNYFNKREKSKMKDLAPYVLSPDSFKKLFWDCSCMFLIFYEIMSIPFKISFDMDISQTFDVITDVIFLTDIIINFNTAYYKNGTLIYERKKIAINYFKCWFWIDLISSTPYTRILEYSLEEEDDSQVSLTQSTRLLKFIKFIRFIKVIRLLRLAKLKSIFDKIEEFLQLSSTIAGLLSFLKLSVFVLFWAHWLGCIFHFIAQNEDRDNNWLQLNNIQDEEWTVRYTISLYWAVTTMTTVGYGDISPLTATERMFGLILLLIACGVFAFTMNSIGAALQQISQKKRQYNNKMVNISKYMKKANIPTDLQNRVRKYLQYIWDSENNLVLQDLVKNLSNDLKQTLLIQVNGNMISYCPILVQLFSNSLLLEITQIIKEETIFPYEFVFLQNEEIYQDKNIYFIQSGEVEILYQYNNLVIQKKGKNDYFGEISFFTNQRRSASVRSITFSGLFYINRSQFLQLIQHHPNDHQKYCDVAHQLEFYQSYTLVKARCYSCEQDDHLAINCPSLHFVMYILLISTSLVQPRTTTILTNRFKRKDRIDFNALTNLTQIRNSQLKFQPEIEKFQEENQEWNLVFSINLLQFKSDIEEYSDSDQDSSYENGLIIPQSLSLIKKPFTQEIIEEQTSDIDLHKYLPKHYLQEESDIYVIMNFERYQEYENFRPKYNITTVLAKFNSKQGQPTQFRGVLPLYNLNEDALQEYVKYYSIDMKQIQFRQYYNEDQKIENLTEQQRSIMKSSRRFKKTNEFIKKPPKQQMKKQILKLKVLKVLKAMKRIQ